MDGQGRDRLGAARGVDIGQVVASKPTVSSKRHKARRSRATLGQSHRLGGPEKAFQRGEPAAKLAHPCSTGEEERKGPKEEGAVILGGAHGGYK